MKQTNFGEKAPLQGRIPKLSDDEIAAIVTYGVGKAVGFSESKLSKEQERIQQYYDGERPRIAHDRDSRYMSLDVYDGVQSMLAQLLETFSANNRPVQFVPMPGEDESASRLRTDYVTDVIHNQNPGYGIFHDTIESGLLFRAGVCKVYWDKLIDSEYLHLSPASTEELEAWLETHPEAEVTEKELAEDGETITRVTIKVPKDKSQVRIKLLAPEEFGISPMAESIEEADLVFHRHEMTASELIKRGYDKDVVNALQGDDRLWMSMQPQRIARFQQTDDLIGTRGTEDGQPSQIVYMVYEAYLELDVDGTEKGQLYKVTVCGNKVLDKEPVDRKPFVAFVPLRRSKAFWGTNYARLLIPTQNARTYLTRSIVNHSLTTNNPRLQVMNGTVKNQRELMENRFGGIINVTRMNGISPIEQAPLNPFVFQTIQLLDTDKEELTGISQLSQGLNKDAISKQNSQGMIQELITVSQVRQKIVARNFAEHFLRPLYIEVYRLVLENEDRNKMRRIAGNWITIPFDQWPEETDVEVSFALGYGEAQKEAAKWAAIDQVLSNPALAAQYTPKQRSLVIRNGLVAAGIKDPDTIFLPIEQAVQPPPNPMMQAEIAMKQADAKAKEAQAQSTLANLQLAQQKQQLDAQIEMQKLQLEKLKIESHVAVQKMQFMHKMTVDAAELNMEAVAAQNDKLNANVNGSIPG